MISSIDGALRNKIISPYVESFQFQDFSNGRSNSSEYLKQIKVDPDRILSIEDRERFHALHQKFCHVFTPQPGKYNGEYGYIENRIQFSTPPPPNSRTHVPNYSPSMNKLMAEKMDILEEWGVLHTI